MAQISRTGQLEREHLPPHQAQLHQNLILRQRRSRQCTDNHSQIAYKYYPYLLSDEVVNRCNIEQKFFEEPELWYLVYSIIMAAEAFHSANFKIGDVRPHNVFISPEGQVRVATQFTWPNEQTNYLKTVFDKETTYLCSNFTS